MAEWQRKQRTAAFASKSNRLPIVKPGTHIAFRIIILCSQDAEAKPAPGSYDIRRDLVKPSFNKKGAFVSKAARSTLKELAGMNIRYMLSLIFSL